MIICCNHYGQKVTKIFIDIRIIFVYKFFIIRNLCIVFSLFANSPALADNAKTETFLDPDRPANSSKIVQLNSYIDAENLLTRICNQTVWHDVGSPQHDACVMIVEALQKFPKCFNYSDLVGKNLHNSYPFDREYPGWEDLWQTVISQHACAVERADAIAESIIDSDMPVDDLGVGYLSSVFSYTTNVYGLNVYEEIRYIFEAPVVRR